MKGNKGITLIALVITIIVLLILAGVSIAMLTGENSILRRGSQADAENQLGAANDAVSLLVAETVADYYEKSYVEPATGGNMLTTAQGGLNKYVASKIDRDAVIAAIGNTNVVVPADTASPKGVDWSGVSQTGAAADRDDSDVVFTFTVTDNTKVYTSKGTYKNGRVTWAITTVNK